MRLLGCPLLRPSKKSLGNVPMRDVWPRPHLMKGKNMPRLTTLVIMILFVTATLAVAQPVTTVRSKPESSLLTNSVCAADDAGVTKETPKDELAFHEQMRLAEITGAFTALTEQYLAGYSVSMQFSVAQCTQFGRPFADLVISAPPMCDYDYCASITTYLGAFKLVLSRRLIASSQPDLGTWAANHAICFVMRSIERTNAIDISEPAFERTEGCVSELVGLDQHARFYLQYLVPTLEDEVAQAEQLNEYMTLIASVVDVKHPRW